MATGTIKKEFREIVITGTWTIPKNNGMAYVEIPNVPTGYIPISASFEVTSGGNYGAFVFALNPTRFYETNGTRGWVTRLRNTNPDNPATLTGTIRVLLYLTA